MTNKTSKLIIAASVGAAGILALGACSSGVEDQGQRDAGAKPSNAGSGSVALTGTLAGVSLHSADGVKCTKYANENKSQQTYRCSHLTPEGGDKAVAVRLPTKNFAVEVKSLTSAEDPLTSVPLDEEGHVVGASKTSNRIVWDSGSVPNPQRGWGVGVGSGESTSNSVIINVTKI